MITHSTARRGGCFMNPPVADRGGTVEPLGGDAGTTGSGEPTVSVESSSASRLVELRASAKGWHGVQLAVLGFIGLCGVLQGAGEQNGPRWLQVLSGVLVLVALVLACSATALVATAAWPVHELADDVAAGASIETMLHDTARRLRLGIVITFVAVVVLALAATASWWPEDTSSQAGGTDVEVTTGQGVVCGQLQEGDPGTVAVSSDGQVVVVASGDVVRLRPVAAC